MATFYMKKTEEDKERKCFVTGFSQRRNVSLIYSIGNVFQTVCKPCLKYFRTKLKYETKYQRLWPVRYGISNRNCLTMSYKKKNDISQDEIQRCVANMQL